MTFNEYTLAHEPAIRLAAFFGIFALMAAWEVAAPRRVRLHSRAVRWTANLGLVVLNTVLLRLLFPLAAVGFAAFAAERGWGLLNNLTLPEPLALLLAVVAMDFAIWLQHVMFHAVPALWRLHQVHHADPDYDLTTGARFHPVEIVLSMLIKISVIAVIGAPAAAVLVFEVLLNATAMFNHGNVKLPGGCRCRIAPAAGDAGHAPRAPLDRPHRGQQQLRLQPFGMGPPVRNLSRAIPPAPAKHGDRRYRPDRRPALREPDRDAGNSLHQFRRGLCNRPRRRGRP
jgi:hypothetical protein